MKAMVRWFRRRRLATRLLVGSLASAIPFYFAAYLGYEISAVAKGGVSPLSVHATIAIVLITGVVYFSRYIASVSAEIQQQEGTRINMLLHAYAQVDRLTSHDLALVHPDESTDCATFLTRLVASVERIKGIVDGAYETFEAAFGKGAISSERIDFEVTFMTKSYRDGFITIPAAANREGRAPRSMLLRQTNTRIYEDSVTARVYHEPRPLIHIIEDTRRPAYGYQELYPGECKRIQSSIVYPVLSDRNDLLGTLVVHCDHAGFFRESDEKHWTDLLEVFAKRLAAVKGRLDAIYAKDKQVAEMTIVIPPLPF